MGSFFTNVHVRSGDTSAVTDFLKQSGLGPAFLKAGTHWTSVLPKITETQKWDTLVTFCERVSEALNTYVIGVLVHDSDILMYVIFQDGKEIDWYDSEPGYWTGEDALPEGGDVLVLSKLCVEPLDEVEMERILRKPSISGDDELTEDHEFIFAEDRWCKIAKLLGMEGSFVFNGFEYVERDSEDRKDFIWVP